MRLEEVRKKYPQYADISDGDLATKLHQKFYSDLPFEDFASRIGYAPAPPPEQPNQMATAFGAGLMEEAQARPATIPDTMSALLSALPSLPKGATLPPGPPLSSILPEQVPAETVATITPQMGEVMQAVPPAPAPPPAIPGQLAPSHAAAQAPMPLSQAHQPTPLQDPTAVLPDWMRAVLRVGTEAVQGTGDVAMGAAGLQREMQRSAPEVERRIEQVMAHTNAMFRQPGTEPMVLPAEEALTSAETPVDFSKIIAAKRAENMAGAAQAAEQSVKTLEDYAKGLPSIKPVYPEGSAARLIEDAATGLGRSAPAMAATIAAPAVGLPAVYAQVRGNSYRQKKERGVDDKTAWDAAGIEAAVSAPLEFGGTIFQLKLFQHSFDAFAKATNLPQKAAVFLKQVIFGGLGEGAEEYLQAHPEELSEIYANNPEASGEELARMAIERFGTKEFQKGAGYQAAAGAIGGGTLGTLGGAFGLSAEKKGKDIAQRQAKREDVQSMLREMFAKQQVPPGWTPPPAPEPPGGAIPKPPPEPPPKGPAPSRQPSVAPGAGFQEEVRHAEGLREDEGQVYGGRRLIEGRGPGEGGPDLEFPQPGQPGGGPFGPTTGPAPAGEPTERGEAPPETKEAVPVGEITPRHKRNMLNIDADIQRRNAKVERWLRENHSVPLTAKSLQIPGYTYSLTRSAKFPGKWQSTTWDDRGEPISDSVYDSYEKALRDNLNDFDVRTLTPIKEAVTRFPPAVPGKEPAAPTDLRAIYEDLQKQSGGSYVDIAPLRDKLGMTQEQIAERLRRESAAGNAILAKGEPSVVDDYLKGGMVDGNLLVKLEPGFFETKAAKFDAEIAKRQAEREKQRAGEEQAGENIKRYDQFYQAPEEAVRAKIDDWIAWKSEPPAYVRGLTSNGRPLTGAQTENTPAEWQKQKAQKWADEIGAPVILATVKNEAGIPKGRFLMRMPPGYKDASFDRVQTEHMIGEDYIAFYPKAETPAETPAPEFDTKREGAINEQIRGLERRIERLRGKLQRQGAMVPPPIKQATQDEIQRTIDEIERLKAERTGMYAGQRPEPEAPKKPTKKYEPKQGDWVIWRGEEWQVGFVNQLAWKGTVRLQKGPLTTDAQANRVKIEELTLIPEKKPEPEAPKATNIVWRREKQIHSGVWETVSEGEKVNPEKITSVMRSHGVDGGSIHGFIGSEKVVTWTPPWAAKSNTTRFLNGGKRNKAQDLAALKTAMYEAMTPEEARRLRGEAVEPEPTPEAEASAKEPWQMTRDDFTKTATVNRGNNFVSVRSTDKSSFVIRTLDTGKYTDADAIEASHKDYIKKAIEQGKPVPPEVLAEYPDLQPKETPRPAKETTTEAPAEPEVTVKPEGDTVVIKPRIKRDYEMALKPAEQKRYLLAEIDAAIKQAPDEYPPDRELTDEEIAEDEEAKKKPYEYRLRIKLRRAREDMDRLGTVTIHIPGDGDFEILNFKPILQEFKKKAQSFPTTKDIKQNVFATPSVKPSGKRMRDFQGWYYNPFKPRTQGLIESEADGGKAGKPRQYYNGGYFSEGHYIIALKQKPTKLKYPIATVVKPEGDEWGAVDVKARVDEQDKRKGWKPAELAGEFYDEPESLHPGDRHKAPEISQHPVLVHVRTSKGEDITLQAKYVDSILTEHPDAKPFARGPLDPVLFRVGGQTVGGVMRMQPYEHHEGIQKHFKSEPKGVDRYGEEEEAPEGPPASVGQYNTRLFRPDLETITVDSKYQTEDGATATVQQTAAEALKDIDEQAERMKALQKCLES